MAAILVEDGLTTSAIEGERLDLDAVRSSVARRLGLPTVGLPTPPRGVDGLIDVLLDATRHHDLALTVERLLGWQAALFPTGYSGLHAIRVGSLRGDEPMQVVSGSHGRAQVHFVAPPRAGLDGEVERFLAWFNAPPTDLDGLVRAGLAHRWFVTLHPFDDGNGRLARAITDMALSQDEGQPMRFFSLSAQVLRERDGYYDILERTQRAGLEVTEWLAWFLRQVELAATGAEQTVADTLAKARFWLRHHATMRLRGVAAPKETPGALGTGRRHGADDHRLCGASSGPRRGARELELLAFSRQRHRTGGDAGDGDTDDHDAA